MNVPAMSMIEHPEQQRTVPSFQELEGSIVSSISNVPICLEIFAERVLGVYQTPPGSPPFEWHIEVSSLPGLDWSFAAIRAMGTQSGSTNCEAWATRTGSN